VSVGTPYCCYIVRRTIKIELKIVYSWYILPRSSIFLWITCVPTTYHIFKQILYINGTIDILISSKVTNYHLIVVFIISGNIFNWCYLCWTPYYCDIFTPKICRIRSSIIYTLTKKSFWFLHNSFWLCKNIHVSIPIIHETRASFWVLCYRI